MSVGIARDQARKVKTFLFAKFALSPLPVKEKKLYKQQLLRCPMGQLLAFIFRRLIKRKGVIQGNPEKISGPGTGLDGISKGLDIHKQVKIKLS